MRLGQSNEQCMYYALLDSDRPVYETDEDGNIIYIEVDGELVPVEVGSNEAVYSKPVAFRASISSQLNTMHLAAFGIDQSGIYSRIVVPKGTLPWKIGTIVWRESPIAWEDEEKQIPKQSSSDYSVVGIMTEGLKVDWYLLQRNSSDSNV